MKRTLLLTLICLCGALPSWSQGAGKNEVYGSGAWARWWDDEGVIATGGTFGGGISRTLVRRFAVEAEVTGFRGSRGYPPANWSYHRQGVQVFGHGLLYVVRRERAQMFLLIGAGATHLKAESTFDGFSYGNTSTAFAADLGAGLKISLSRHWILRPELRLVGSGGRSSYLVPFSAEVRASMGLGYRW